MTDNTLPAATNEQLAFFNSYGNTASMTTITGSLLKFDKGDWLLGSEGSEVEKDRQFTCVMDELMIGWTKWEDQKPVATDMGRLIEGFTPPKREALGDTDEDLWEEDDKGNKRDPWQFTNTLLLRTPGTNGDDDSDLFTYSTSSRGGINCIGDLCKKFVAMTKTNGLGYPVITLGMEAYNHPTYGRVKKPVFKIVGWEPKKNEDVKAKAKVESKPEPKAEPKAAAKGKKGK